ncbi:pilus (MSHA type) biogenesis protein MshL [Halospina denitrificans]|nr:pilus (MSHA type) biogenesis protein MshL [Halospina denitrificans]
MGYVLKQIVAGAVSLVVLGGCASNPLMQTSTASSTETTQSIEDSLDEALESAPSESQRQAPDDVTDALMPEMGGGGSASMEEAFNVDARKLPAETFFQSLVDGTDYNAVVHPQVSGSISLELDQVTVPEVMDLVSDMYGFHIERQNNIFRIQPGGVQTRVFQIDYLDIQRRGTSETQVRSGQVTDANGGSSGTRNSNGDDNGVGGAVVGTRITTRSESTFWADLNESLNMIVGDGQNQKVITTPGSGVVVVQATPEKLATVEDYLRRMQLISKRQVILEAKILEVELSDEYQQGINWNAVDEVGGGTIDAGLSSIGAGTQNGGGVFSAALDVGGFDSLIELLGTQGNVQVLSSPRISTVNNEKAVIKVGSDEFFVTDLDFDDSTTAASQTSRSTSVDLTPFFSGISLDVTPQISENDVVTLHVHPAVSEVEDQQKLITIGDEDVTLPLALSTVRETDSVVSARSGEIVVIGGLMQESTEETTSAVPFFSEIPVLGELFKQRRFESRKSELVILLKPMVAGAEQWREDIEGSRERMRELRRIMESTEAPGPKPATSRQRQR